MGFVYHAKRHILVCTRRTPFTYPHCSASRVEMRVRCYHAPCTPQPEPLKLPNGHISLLPLVHRCSNLTIELNDHSRTLTVGTRTSDGSVEDQETVVPFVLSNHDEPGHTYVDGKLSELEEHQLRRPLGLLRPKVVESLEHDHHQHESEGKRSPWNLAYCAKGTVESASFASWVNEGGQRARTKQMNRLISEWKRDKVFQDILRGWSNEPYPIYNHPPRVLTPQTTCEPVAFAIERAALPLFGFPNFGSLLIGYFQSPDTGKTMLWIPRRSLNKRTWPGKLDVTVGGGIGLGYTAIATIIRECAEEASLDHEYVEKYVRPAGVLPFPNRSPANWILPGVYYTFDLPLPSDGSVRPRPNIEDGEVESFEVMDTETVLEKLVQDKFKSSSALAVVDFMIRHGFVTGRSDPRFVEVCRQLKRSVDLPIPWRS
ncbi:hypothetical protein BDN72DRAFT_832730 [Pluteus cervinus]|uniref:Uncharacterized protein n=1 Tax=Pluteus cervinus TaxID=181527 RepID=A0ACD3BAH7_9AGAR|nr:hypothetical protein BDN72DRAFT_832730 [Pluteus cervinus]